MKLKHILVMAGILSGTLASAASLVTDTFRTPNGKEVMITFIKHGSLMLRYDQWTVQVDPVSDYANYASFPKADVILITHEHSDHLDSKAVDVLSGNGTQIVANEAARKKLGKGVSLKNGSKMIFLDKMSLEAVPAYNTTPGREKYHPRGNGNGYILTIDGFRIYIAGDTEDIPEMKKLKDIDVAFLPVNQPYTMTVPQVIHAAKMFMPKVLYPYHFGDTDLGKLKEELKGSGIDVRIRQME